MSNLGKLLAMQKAKTNATPAAAASAPDDSQADATQAPAPAPKTGTAIAGKLNLLKRAGDSGTGGRVLPKTGDSTGPVGNSDVADRRESEVDGPAEFSLDDLAGFTESDAPALTSRDRQIEGSGFLDEIEATAPDRDLPADLESQQLLFVESLDNIYQVLNDPEMFGQSVRIIMMELQENPEYIKLISDQDVHTMIRAMRNTMGLARIKKQEKTRKPRAAAAAKKGKVDDKAMGMLDSLLGGDDDD